MIRNKVTLLGAAVALLASSIGLASSASAVTITFNTQSATVTCNSIIAASATLAPPLTSLSTGTAVVKVKGTLNGCTETGSTPAGLVIVSGSFSGTLNTVGAPGCVGLLLPATITGNLVAKWKVASGQKLDFASTRLSGGSLTGGLFAPGLPYLGTYGQFTLSGQSIAASSAFAAAAPSTVATTTEDAGYLGGACAAAPPGKGIKTIHLGLGTIIA